MCSLPCSAVLHHPSGSLTLRLDMADIASIRFGISPLSETIGGLQLLGNPWNKASQTSQWIRWAAARLARRRLDLSNTWPLIVNERPSWPQFLLPAPSRTATTLDEALDTMRQTSAGQVRFSLRRIFGQNPPPCATELAAHPEAGLRAIAAELRQAHDLLIAPHWPRIRAVLEADIDHRAKQLVAGGARHALAGLHPDLDWSDGQLTLHGDSRPTPGRPPGGLVLSPVVLGPPWVLIKLHTTTQTTLRYPARGIANLWTSPPSLADGTIRLLGRARSELLAMLRSPTTTGDLAQSLGVTPSAVSQHLRVLRATRLVKSHRTGHHVIHHTTALGLALLEP